MAAEQESVADALLWRIRAAEQSDANDIANIYNYYIEHTIVTFDEEKKCEGDMLMKIEQIQSHFYPFFVVEEIWKSDECGNSAMDPIWRVAGFAYGGEWKARKAYAHSVEISIYLSHLHTGKGYGSKLMEALLDEFTRRGTHAVMSGVALPNPSSVALHTKFGFAKCAHFSEVGFKFGKWIDVGYWQKILTSSKTEEHS